MKLNFFLLFFLVILFLPSVDAATLNPSIVNIDYEAGSSQDVEITITSEDPMVMDLSIDFSELSPSAASALSDAISFNIDQLTFTESVISQEFVASIVLPDELVGGRHEINIKATEQYEGGDSTIGSYIILSVRVFIDNGAAPGDDGPLEGDDDGDDDWVPPADDDDDDGPDGNYSGNESDGGGDRLFPNIGDAKIDLIVGLLLLIFIYFVLVSFVLFFVIRKIKKVRKTLPKLK
jgi:hypothetical protein